MLAKMVCVNYSSYSPHELQKLCVDVKKRLFQNKSLRPLVFLDSQRYVQVQLYKSNLALFACYYYPRLGLLN